MENKKKYGNRVLKKGTFVSILRELTQTDSGTSYLWFWARSEGKDYKVTVFDEQATAVCEMREGDRISFYGTLSGDMDEHARTCFTASSVSILSGDNNSLAAYAIERYGSTDAMREAHKRVDEQRLKDGFVRLSEEPNVWLKKEHTLEYQGRVIRKIDFVGEILGYGELSRRLKEKNFRFGGLFEGKDPCQEYRDYLGHLVSEARSKVNNKTCIPADPQGPASLGEGAPANSERDPEQARIESVRQEILNRYG